MKHQGGGGKQRPSTIHSNRSFKAS